MVTGLAATRTWVYLGIIILSVVGRWYHLLDKFVRPQLQNLVGGYGFTETGLYLDMKI